MTKNPDIKENSLYNPVIVREEVDGSHYYYVDGKFFPGVTTILHETLPMPFALKNWLGEVGNERAQQKLEAAGDRGTAIHNACEALLRGQEVDLEHDFKARADKKCVAAFANWVYEMEPFIQSPKDIETTLASATGFAGTLDILCYIKDEPWIVDIKTSAGVYDAHKLQQMAYKQALYEMRGINAHTAILHLNHKTKKGWTFVDKMEIGGREIDFSDFMKVFEVYKMLNGGVVKDPPKKDVYPPVISLYKKEIFDEK